MYPFYGSLPLTPTEIVNGWVDGGGDSFSFSVCWSVDICIRLGSFESMIQWSHGPFILVRTKGREEKEKREVGITDRSTPLLLFDIHPFFLVEREEKSTT